jgi:transposase-like protein
MSENTACAFCTTGHVEEVLGCYPWTESHFMCVLCDSTYLSLDDLNSQRNEKDTTIRREKK